MRGGAATGGGVGAGKGRVTPSLAVSNAATTIWWSELPTSATTWRVSEAAAASVCGKHNISSIRELEPHALSQLWARVPLGGGGSNG